MNILKQHTLGKTLAVGALLLASLSPIAASAQSRGEVRDSRQDVREEKRELGQAKRTGDKRDVRGERKDVNSAKREYRDDLADYRDNRVRNRNQYHATPFKATFKRAYFRPGARVNAQYYNSRYAVNNWSSYRLPAPRYNQRWVRHYNDVVLIDYRTGIVIRSIPGFYW